MEDSVLQCRLLGSLSTDNNVFLSFFMIKVIMNLFCNFCSLSSSFLLAHYTLHILCVQCFLQSC